MLHSWSAESCRGAISERVLRAEIIVAERIYNVLFLCTHNSARSIIAEVITNHVGRGNFKAYSAGSYPATTPNPFAL